MCVCICVVVAAVDDDDDDDDISDNDIRLKSALLVVVDDALTGRNKFLIPYQLHLETQ